MHVGANDIALMKIVKKFKGGLWKKISLPIKDYKHINVKDYSSSKMEFFKSSKLLLSACMGGLLM